MTSQPQLSATSSSTADTQKLKSLRIKHPRIAQVMDEFNALIYPGSQDSILLICGPTGVGKTTMAKHLRDATLRQAASDMEVDAGLVPSAYVEAISSGEDQFNWPFLFESILEEIDPLAGMPRAEYGIDADTGRFVRPKGSSYQTRRALRQAAVKALRARGTRALIIDEAAHIIQNLTTKKTRIQVNTIKSMANMSHTQAVLIGSYDLYELMSLSGQLARRTHVIHLERYREDRPEDVHAFHSCVKQFQDTLPHIWGGGLMPYADALMENALGCIGTLGAILTRAARFAIADGQWSEHALCRALITEGQRKTILAEILEGEDAIGPGLTRLLPKVSRKSASRLAA